MFPKPLYSLAAALLAAPMVHGHYIFSQLLVNGAAQGGDYDYIRKNTNSYEPSFTSDVINSEDLRCNKGASAAASKTFDVKAGDEIGAKLSFNEFIEHPGPAMIYMSKAPGSIDSYTGDGDWFKVWESGPENGPANVDTSWGTWQKESISFTIPADLPDGEYLTRFEHVAIHENHVGKSQFYMECAQLSVTGGGSGTPGPTAKIPGMYTAEDPAFTYSIWDGTDPGYTMPGPAVWTSGKAASGSSTSTDSSASSSTDTETEAPASSGASTAASTGSSTGASTGASTDASAGGYTGASTDASTGGYTGASTGSESVPASGSASTGATTGASTDASAGQYGAPAASTSGEMSASQGAPATGGSYGGVSTGGAAAGGSYGGASTAGASTGGSYGGASTGGAAAGGSWGTASTSDKRDCDVEYVGGSASRARRAVQA
jgi:hypothetical protein